MKSFMGTYLHELEMHITYLIISSKASSFPWLYASVQDLFACLNKLKTSMEACWNWEREEELSLSILT